VFPDWKHEAEDTHVAGSDDNGEDDKDSGIEIDGYDGSDITLSAEADTDSDFEPTTQEPRPILDPGSSIKDTTCKGYGLCLGEPFLT
jgi:hypothetical protein